MCGFRAASFFGPMPGTWRRSSAELNFPWVSRYSTMAWAVLGPIPGRVSSSSTLAVFTGMGMERTFSLGGARGSKETFPFPSPSGTTSKRELLSILVVSASGGRESFPFTPPAFSRASSRLVPDSIGTIPRWFTLPSTSINICPSARGEGEVLSSEIRLVDSFQADGGVVRKKKRARERLKKRTTHLLLSTHASRLLVLLQLVVDGIHQSLPAGLDDVFGDPHRPPSVSMISGFDEYAHLGPRAFARGKDADFIVHQFHVV